jgi:hypothetical protein
MDTAPVRTARRTLVVGVMRVYSSVRKRWTQRSQFGGIPRNPSPCEIAFGAKLCSSTP